MSIIKKFLQNKQEDAAKIDSKALSHLLLVDGTNNFIRGFTGVKTLNRDGVHIGGVQGFLTSLARCIKVINPSKIMIAFDGEDGSQARKNIYPLYKANRKNTRISNKDISYETEEEEDEAMEDQRIRLVDYLRCLPVHLFCIDFVEADDVLGFLRNKYYPLYDRITIMSTDKDYLQLVDEKTYVYNPAKKVDDFNKGKVYDQKKVLEDYGIHPLNFLTYRCITGDTGDNVPNVPGVQHKTAIKMFPELANDTKLDLDFILTESNNRKSKRKTDPHIKLLEFTDQLKLNKELMDLSDPYISEVDLGTMRHELRNLSPLNALKFCQYHKEDGLDINDPMSWLTRYFSSIK